MGNESSLIKRCTVVPKPRHSTSEWSLFDASHGGQQYSLFVFSDQQQHPHDIARWKHIRHPNLVKCYDTGLCKGKQSILTEPVTSIRPLLDRMHEYCKLSGLYNVGEALSFLHRICGISVNNLSIDSIFICPNDSNKIWKVGSLYWYSSLDTDSEDFFRQLITFHTSHGTLKTLPPEDREMSSHKLIRSSKLIHRRDSYAFAAMINELLYDPKKPPKLAEMILAVECEVFNLSLQIKSFIENFNSIQADQRPTVAELLANKLFVNCIFLQIRQFFINFGTHSEFERARFYETLIERLRMLPDPILVVNIFSMIVSSRVIMSSQFIYNHVMPHFLIPFKQTTSTNSQLSTVDPVESNVLCNNSNTAHEQINTNNTEQKFTLTNGQVVVLSPIISTDIFEQHIMPHLSSLYCVHDYKIRILLLQYLPHYGSLIPKGYLRKIILPQILLGIKDSDSQLVALTLRALAVLVDIFGVVTVLGGSKRSRYFSTGIPRENNLIIDSSNSNSSSISQKDSIDERDNVSTVSAKSNNSSLSNSSSLNFANYKMPAHMISERSSPDGDEIDDNHRLESVVDSLETNSVRFHKSNEIVDVGVANLNLVDDDEDWPEWDTATDSNGFETAVESFTSSDTLHSSSNEAASTATKLITNEQTNLLNGNVKRNTLEVVQKQQQNKKLQSDAQNFTKVKPNLQTFDIKDIDFQPGSKEIDNLFLDMEPVLDFSQQKKFITNSLPTDGGGGGGGVREQIQILRTESPLPTLAVNSQLFVPNHEHMNGDDDDIDVDVDAGDGWQNDDSFEFNASGDEGDQVQVQVQQQVEQQQ